MFDENNQQSQPPKAQQPPMSHQTGVVGQPPPPPPPVGAPQSHFQSHGPVEVKTSNPLPGIILVIVLILLAAGGAFAWFYFGSSAEPHEVVVEMLNAVEDQEQYAYSGDVSVDIAIPEPDEEEMSLGPDLTEEFPSLSDGAQIGLVLNGAVDERNQEERKASLDIDLDIEDLIMLGLDTRAIAQRYYGRLDELEFADSLGEEVAFVEGFVSPFSEQWILFDLTDIVADAPEELQSLFNSATDNELSPAEQQLNDDFEAAFLRNKPFDVNDKSGLFGKTYEYEMTLNKERFELFVIEAKTILANYVEQEQDVRAAADLEEDFAELVEEIDGLESLQVSLAINKKSMLPEQVTFVLAVSPEEDTSAVITGSFAFQFGESVQVTEPTDAMNVMELMEQAMGEMMMEDDVMNNTADPAMGNVDLPAIYRGTGLTIEEIEIVEPFEAIRDGVLSDFEQESLQKVATDEDGDGLNLYLEGIFATSDTNSDTDGDGFDDRDEVLAGYDPYGEGELPEQQKEMIINMVRLHEDAVPLLVDLYCIDPQCNEFK